MRRCNCTIFFNSTENGGTTSWTTGSCNALHRAVGRVSAVANCLLETHLRQSSRCAGRSCPTSASKTFNCRPSSSKRIRTSTGLACPRSTYCNWVSTSNLSHLALGYNSTMLVEELISFVCWAKPHKDKQREGLPTPGLVSRVTVRVTDSKQLLCADHLDRCCAVAPRPGPVFKN